MNEEPPSNERRKGGGDYRRRIEAREARKLRARREGRESPLSGFAAFGIVGWSIAIPTLLGIALGWWIDRRWPGPYSWTLMLLFGGLILGCLNAWNWIQKEQNR